MPVSILLQRDKMKDQKKIISFDESESRQIRQMIREIKDLKSDAVRFISHISAAYHRFDDIFKTLERIEEKMDLKIIEEKIGEDRRL